MRTVATAQVSLAGKAKIAKRTAMSATQNRARMVQYARIPVHRVRATRAVSRRKSIVREQDSHLRLPSLSMSTSARALLGGLAQIVKMTLMSASHSLARIAQSALIRLMIQRLRLVYFLVRAKQVGKDLSARPMLTNVLTRLV
jgi:hypothetical protein